MKDCEFLRLIEEIGVFLDLKMTTIVQVIEFYKRFNESETHSYKQEVQANFYKKKRDFSLSFKR